MNLAQQIETLNRIASTIIVNDSEGKIETSEVIKSKNGFRNITNSVKYSLKKNQSSLLNSVFTDIKLFANKYQFRYYKLNFFQKIFSNKKKVLLKNIDALSVDSSWIILPISLVNIIDSHQDFRANSNSIDNILIGFFDKKMLYKSPEVYSNEIIFGNYDSFDIIINQLNGDYQLIEKNKITILELI